MLTGILIWLAETTIGAWIRDWLGKRKKSTTEIQADEEAKPDTAYNDTIKRL